MTLRTLLATSLLSAALLPGITAAPVEAAAFIVTSAADPGNGICDATCTLREAIAAANAAASPPHTITFNIAGAGPHTITITGSTLPTLTKEIDIDGSAEAISGAPGIRLTQSGLASGDGLVFGSAADGSSVSYLSITGFPGNGVFIASGSTGASVTRCYIGLAPDGVTDAGNGLTGILVAGANAAIGTSILDGNRISGNGADGVLVQTGADGTTIRGNYIGTSSSGTAAVPNDSDGIAGSGGTGVIVGGASALFSVGNVIAGNGGAGVVISGGAASWSILGNNIGVDATGAAPLGNTDGIKVYTDGNTIGSTSVSGRNIIAANEFNGIYVDTTADLTSIFGNHIGINGVGSAAVGTQGIGIRVFGTNCTIGGSDSTYRNVISGHASPAIALESSASGCSISANYIGLNAAGDAAIANGGGVGLGGSGNTLGGATAGKRNVISGNSYDGVALYGTGNAVQGNYIGTNPSGAVAIANAGNGIRVITATSGTIGGSTVGQGNVISGNTNQGIATDGDTSAITIQGNLVGVDATGVLALPNGGGMSLGGTNHIVGGATAAAGNVVSGNTGGGISLSGTGHTLRGNKIGTNAAGSVAVANGGVGVQVYGGSGHEIGGAAAGEGNLISGNTNGGIELDGTGSFVRGNKVGTNLAGTAAIANGGGIGVYGSGHTIGGGSAGARNLISGNPFGGLFLTGSGHVIAGNYVGTTADGTAAIAGNNSYGIRADTLVDSTIGGLVPAEGNVIAGNSRGVNLGYGSHGNFLLNNVIGLNAAATTDLADSGTGIEIGDSYDNTIGLPDAGNVIAGMAYHGISISGAGSYGNLIQGNWIGTNKALATTLGNDFAGIFVTDSSGNTIGGTGDGEGNVLAHNYQFGVWVERGEGNEISGNSIYGNFFGIDIDEQGFFPNDGGDGDDGGNRRQNYPLISSAVVNGGNTDVEGLLINEPNTEYRVEFFSSPDCGNAGFGQGKTFRGSTQVVTSGGGQAPIATSIPLAIADDFLTATVTDPLGNTSEFSPCAQVDLGENPGKFQFDREAYVGYEGIIPTTKVIVTRSHGLSGTATVNFTTSNGSALAGADYTDSDQTLTFAPWEVVKHVEVPILLEVAPEPDFEKVLLALSSPSAGASLGTPATSEIQIIDFTDDYPGLTVGDAFVTEGNSGQKILSFEVKLTATDHEVKVTYLTEPGSAVEGEDYLDATAVLTFPPSASTQTQNVQIQILGDTDVEADEIVWLRITTAPGSGNWIAYDTYGRGEIRNDDFATAPPSNTIFADGFEIGTAALWSGTVPAP